jgi:hypothetical protein
VLNAVSNLAMKVSMNAMESHIVEAIISICLHQSVLDAIAQLWKITFQHSTVSSIPIVLCAG